jgi:plasmid maintenance system antidote protein VapI
MSSGERAAHHRAAGRSVGTVRWHQPCVWSITKPDICQQGSYAPLPIPVDKAYGSRVAVSPRILEAQRHARTHVPNVLRTFLRVTGHSQQELADALGVTQPAISRRLRGTGTISQDELVAVAAFFEVPVESFYKDLPDAVTDLLTAQKRCIAPAAA